MRNSPWGKVQTSVKIARGITFVTTAGHGGVLVARGVASKRLSCAARSRGMAWQGYLAYEEDVAINIIFIEVPEAMAVLYCSATHEEIVKSLSLWIPEYLVERGITPDTEAYARYLDRKRDAEMRQARHPNLIVAARGLDSGMVEVYTADDKIYVVTATSYESRRCPNLLSDCQVVSP